MLEKMKTESVYVGYDLKKFSDIRLALDHEHIDYKYRLHNHEGQFLAPGRGTIRGQFGSAGMNADHTCEYEIKVAVKDRERARRIAEEYL